MANDKRKTLSLLDKMAKLNPALAEQSAVLADPYAPIARDLQTVGQTLSSLSEDARKAKGNAWTIAKRAVMAAVDVGHNPASFALGFQIACENNGVPLGTFRGYIGPLKGMVKDVEAGVMDAAAVETITVKDARAKYEEKTDDVKRRERLMAAWKLLNAEQQAELLELAESQAQAAAEPAEGEGEATETLKKAA